MNLYTELKRRNVFKVAAAYVIVGWLVMQAGDTLAPALHLPDWVNSALAFFLILGFPLAVFFAWVFELTPEGLKKEKEVDRTQSITSATGQKLNVTIIALMALALSYFAWDKFGRGPAAQRVVVHPSADTGEAIADAVPAAPIPQAPDSRSIAVLPFVNMSDDADNEYFSDGITEDVLNLLAKIPELKVTSRSSVFSLKGQNIDIPTVAKKLHVSHILEGSVRKAGERVRITAQLIEAGSDTHVWSESYDRELDDIFAIQDEIARKVVDVLHLKLLGGSPVTNGTDTGAYSAYLQGRHFLQLENVDGRAAAHEAFSRAVEIDPAYAPAWAGLSQSLRAQANWGEIDLDSGTQAARKAVLRALEIDETLAQAWAMLARIQWVYDWDWSTAESTINKALTQGPGNVDALSNAANIAKTLGHYKKAIEFYIQALELDPLNAVVLTELGSAYAEAGQLDQAVQTFERILKLYPDHDITYGRISIVRSLQGRAEEALQLAEKENYKPTRVLANALAFHALGREQEASQAARYLVETQNEWLAYQIAFVFAFQGQPDKAFEWLETAYEQRDGGITHILGDLALKSLHRDPRWEPYLLKLGLLDYWKDLQTERRAGVL